MLAALLVWLAVAGRRAGGAEDLPPAPAGFAWQRLPEIHGALLVPSSWRHRCCQGDMGWKSTETETGVPDPASFTLSVIRYGRRVSRQDAEKTAVGFMKGLSAQLKPVETWDSTRGPFVGKAGIFVDEHAAASSRKEHKAFIHVLVSPETSTLCIVVFDAPSREWDAKWGIGKVIADTFVLEDVMM
jgi:hypothetical protein